ncbi:hypothetical protein FRC01_012897 [Tulasnella sp. 417]|nr:hypothetical protein FRC01_012897 [Tulasnella sp. 417]
MSETHITSGPTTPPRPRKRGRQTNGWFQGTRPTVMKQETLSAKLKSSLSLDFDPEEWQLTIIQRILQRYDVIFTAGTSYGKSLVFEGVAAMAGKKRVCIVVTPLKALERDQVQEATKKGLTAVMINENNSSDTRLWREPSFRRMWSSRKFSERVAGVFVDEAHCIHEWGDEFRPVYQELATLRVYAGYDIPMIACSATLPTEKFSVVWDKLDYGHRPFFGVDAGTDRSNLLFLVRPVENPDDPARDVLHMLPRGLTAASTAEDLKFKVIFYIQNETACRKAKDTIRRCLPSHLRNMVYNFSSSLSEKAKQGLWDRFKKGEIKILFSTDAAGMGCNVPDIDLVVVAGDPSTVSAVEKRWGRAARRRSHLGTCLLLLPKWAFRPTAPPPETLHPEGRGDPSGSVVVGATRGRTKGGASGNGAKGKRAAGPKPNPQREMNRLKMQPALEEMVNLSLSGHDTMPLDTVRCIHKYLKAHFRPDTGLDSYNSLHVGQEPEMSSGWRSQRMPFTSSWHVLELSGRSPRPERCCHLCNPDLLDEWKAPPPDDDRLTAFASDFIFPAKTQVASTTAAESSAAADPPIGLVNRYYPVRCTVQDEEELVRRLEQWSPALTVYSL